MGIIPYLIFGFMMILYIVIYLAVKDAIDRSEVGKILIKKYGEKEPNKTRSAKEIEK